MILFSKSPIIKHYDLDLSKRWHIEYYDENNVRHKICDGKPFGITGNGNRYKTKKERLAFFTTLLNAVMSGQDVKQKEAVKGHLLEVTITSFLDDKKLTIGDKTLTDYRSRILMFNSSCRSGLMLHEVTKREILAFLLRKKMSDTNYNNDLRVVKTFFNWCVAEKLITENPSEGIKYKVATTEGNVAYSVEQAVKLLERIYEVDTSLWLCCMFEYYAFMRPKEIGLMSWEDFNFETNTITIRGKISKNKKQRIVPMHPGLRAALLDHKIDMFDKNYNRDFFKTKWTRAKPKMISLIPKGCTLYSFKHTGCCELYKATKDIRLVSRLCGHSRIDITETYLKSLGMDVSGDQVVFLPTLF